MPDQQNDMQLAHRPSGLSATPVRERPILFSPAMVRAILEGRKTQTRRVVKPANGWEKHSVCDPSGAADAWAVWHHYPETDRVGHLQECPYGKPGDRLWVKEGWRPLPLGCTSVAVRYLAGGPSGLFPGDGIPADWKWPKAAERGGVTALFMPRWASRITLEITDVRVQRVQEISEEDAIAEGVTKDRCGKDPAIIDRFSCRDGFAYLWDSINEKRGFGWQKNPWVWCISFRRVPQQGPAQPPDGGAASNSALGETGREQ